VGNALGGVVHYHGQLVGKQAIGAQQHTVAHILANVLGLPAQPAVCAWR